MIEFIRTTGSKTLLQTLTPAEKWQAVRRIGDNIFGEPTFLIVCITALLILTIALIAVSYRQKQSNLRAANELFAAYADRRGLSRRERHILFDIAIRAKLKRKESIFTLAEAFNRGAARVTDETAASYGTRRSRLLGAELAGLREKLGFERRASDSSGSTAKPGKPCSRQIGVGKKIRIKPLGDKQPENAEATVIKNDEIELAAKLSTPLEAESGDPCCVRYYFGSSIWEFDSSVLSCHGRILILTHGYDVRFINRRRFLRVPVRKPAFIASFPFARTFSLNGNNIEHIEPGSADASTVPWGPPEFVPGKVTELAGPGLCIEAPLKVDVGDRVVVILKMNTESNFPKGQDDSARRALMRKQEPNSSRVVEDIGEVRHVKAMKDGFSIAVELTGLSDSNVNELVRETNLASFAVGATDRVEIAAGKDKSSGIAAFAENAAV